MAQVDVSVSSDMNPEQAWKLASDLQRIGDWLTIFGGWRSEVPAAIENGTRVSSCIKVKGFRNVIHWQVTGYDPPKCLRLSGTGRGGVRIELSLTISDNRSGSTFHLIADLSGPLLSGPVGTLVARVLQSDVRKSVHNLAALS
ncbi:MAG: SRPBCC family protein [Mycobacteriaceae bacterium]|nr:SRPBCC family protein [Mycobacteriaceae bacterium]MBV9641639.1 SRPBCC family protein [Mycobacteriaceae bacterium]